MNKLRGHLDSLVLGALAGGPAQGYEVIVRLRERGEGDFDLAGCTLYPALHRMEASGLLSAETSEVRGRRRKIYTLTAAGRQELAEQRVQWRRFSASVTRVIGVPT